jgi:cytoskeletal protein CcmA (bactofilin family)
MKILRLAVAVLALLSFLVAPSSSYAATFRNGETITISESLKDLYVTGGTVSVAGATQNDLTAAGGTVRIEGNVSNDALVAGGNVTLSGSVGDTARVAGGNVIIESPIANDLVAAGGTIDITSEASIGGDLVVAGGTLQINGPVRGNIWVTGGNVVINSTVGGTVHGVEVDELRLGPNAVINGNLDYTGEQKASIANGAVVKGEQNFKQERRQSDDETAGALAGIATAGTLFKLIAAVLVSLFAIWLLPRFLVKSSEQITSDPLKIGLLGFATLILMPIVSLILLILWWLGVASLLLYLFLLVVSTIVVYVFVGWWVLKWWYGRDKKRYELDWMAGVVGPAVVTILWFIPIIGWLINFILWLMALGALMLQLWNFVTLNRASLAKAKK